MSNEEKWAANRVFLDEGIANREEFILATVGGATTLYVNKYYEKAGDTVTTSYYLGGRLAAQRESTTLRYIHQDHLTGTSVTTASNGSSSGSIRYLPFGECRNSQGSIGTDRLFTGQILDSTGLYYYGARYYDPGLGRFISPDPTIPDINNPQSHNRYSYVINNPLIFIDPSGLDFVFVGGSGTTDETEFWMMYDYQLIAELTGQNFFYLSDNDPERFGKLWDVGPRLQQLTDLLNSGNVRDIHLIGHSEGAATIATFLSQLTNDPASVSSSVREQLRSASLYDMPTWPYIIQNSGLPGTMYNLPQRLSDAGINITLLDVWNTASPVHVGGVLSGWEGKSYWYDSRSWFEKALSVVSPVYWAINIARYHEDPVGGRRR